MAKPTVIPEWAISNIVDGVSGVNNVVEPIGAKKNTGFVRNEYPPRQDVNWLFRIIYTWINWFNDSGACDFWIAAVADTGVVTTDFGAGVGGSTNCRANDANGAIVGASNSCHASGGLSAIFACNNCDVTGDDSGILGANDSNVIGNHSVILGSDTCIASAELSASLASENSTADCKSSAIIASEDSGTNDSGTTDFRQLIGASKDANIDNASDAAIIASNKAWVAGDKAVVIGSSDSYALGAISSVISSSKCAALKEGSSVINSHDSSCNDIYAMVLASTYCSNRNSGSITGGTAGDTDLDVPAIAIVTAGNGGRTAVSGGDYTGVPLGDAHPIYEIKAGSDNIPGSETEFIWRKLTGYDANSDWSAPIAITGGAQNLDDGVTVTFSTDVGWTQGEWTITIDDLEYLANCKWEIDSADGGFTGSAFTVGVPYPDLAEYFENFETGVIPLGTIVRLEGRKIMPITDKNYDNMLGVISGTAGVRLGDTSFTWGKKFLTGDFGEPLYEKELNEHGRKVRKINPDYDGTIPNVKRSERPEEWSLVALLGQVYVRVPELAVPGDQIGRFKVMEITKKFIKKDGYAIAFCLLR